MSTAAPVQDEVGPQKPGPSSLAPEVQERILFARVMILLIVPLYVLILLTLGTGVPHLLGRIGWLGQALMEWFRAYWPVVFRGLILMTCTATPLYCLLGAARLVLGRATWKYVIAAQICVLVGIGEAVGIALAVFRYHVTL